VNSLNEQLPFLAAQIHKNLVYVSFIATHFYFASNKQDQILLGYPQEELEQLSYKGFVVYGE
jgi:hypothetical protein